MSAVISASETPVRTQNDPHKRGCLFAILRGVKWFGLCLGALMALGVAYQTIATEIDRRTYAPCGQLYMINGHQMHIVCKGEGSPAVILQAGGANGSLWWYWVQNQLAEHTQVCAYDRPGLGWSEPASGPRDPVIIVVELHALLEQAGVRAPYVMAGHSYGAVLARVYAAQYPQDVSGIALVDSMPLELKYLGSEREFDEYKSIFYAAQAPLWVMSRLGLGRLMGSEIQNLGYPPDNVPEMLALAARNQTVDTDFAEKGFEGMWALMQASLAAENLGNLPMVVLWASLSGTNQESYASFREEVAGYGSNSLTRYVEGTNHGAVLGNEQYAQQVSDTILDVIGAAQTGEPLAQ